MYDKILFVYDNLKVTLNPNDAPYYGFEMFAGEAECNAKGTLYDLGSNAGYFPKGDTEVKGQVWTTGDDDLIDELKDFAYPMGNVLSCRIRVNIIKDGEQFIIPATVFALPKVPNFATRVESGFWSVKISNKA